MAFFGNRRRQENEADEESQTEAGDAFSRAITTNEEPEESAPVAQQPLGFETVLGASSVLEGDFKSEGNIRLDGTLSGTLSITGNVLIGETADIQADVHAKNVSIAGTVRGNVSGNKVQLLRTSRVWGDITAKALTTEEGAFIDGKISMQTPEDETSGEKSTPQSDTAGTQDALTEAEPEEEKSGSGFPLFGSGSSESGTSDEQEDDNDNA